MTADVAAKPNAKTNSGANTPSFAELKRRVEDLLPLVEADADESERISHLTDRLVDKFRKAELYRLLNPKEIGGLEVPFAQAMELTEPVAHADGSAGWYMMVANVIGASMSAFVTDSAARTIFAKTADVTVAGNGVPRGLARKVKGGYQIKGHWSYGSTIYHAEWIHSGCFLTDDGKTPRMTNGAPEIVLCHHPRDTIELKDNWNVLGLRGTGSFDYVLKDGELFVADEMCFPFDGAEQRRGGIQYSAGLVTLTTWGHTAWALGVGRRALDELAAHARGRTDAFGKLTDSATFKKAFADAEAKYRSARAFVYDSWRSLDDSYARGETANLEQIACIRLAMRHLHDVISEVSTFAHRTSRGHSLRPSVLQRCYRDIHAGTQHILLADEIVQECGKVLVGAAPENAEWAMFAVRAPGEAAGH